MADANGLYCVPSLNLDGVCLTCVPISCLWCCFSVQCFLEGPQSPLKPMYTSRKSKSEFFYSSSSFPHQSPLQGQGIQIPLYSLEKWWKDLMGHAGESWSGGHGTGVLRPVPPRYRCHWACRCSLWPCPLQGNRYVALWHHKWHKTS